MGRVADSGSPCLPDGRPLQPQSRAERREPAASARRDARTSARGEAQRENRSLHPHRRGPYIQRGAPRARVPRGGGATRTAALDDRGRAPPPKRHRTGDFGPSEIARIKDEGHLFLDRAPAACSTTSRAESGAVPEPIVRPCQIGRAGAARRRRGSPFAERSNGSRPRRAKAHRRSRRRGYGEQKYLEELRLCALRPVQYTGIDPGRGEAIADATELPRAIHQTGIEDSTRAATRHVLCCALDHVGDLDEGWRQAGADDPRGAADRRRPTRSRCSTAREGRGRRPSARAAISTRK